MLNGRPMFHKQAVRLRLAKMKMLIDPLDSMAILLAGRLSVARNTSNMVPDLSADCAGFKAMCTSVLSKCIQSASILFGGRAFEKNGPGAIIARLQSEVHAMHCAGGTHDVLMEQVARNMLMSSI